MNSNVVSEIQIPRIPFFQEFWQQYFPNIVDENTITDKFHFVALSNLNTTFDQFNSSNQQEIIISSTLFQQILSYLLGLQKIIDNIAQHLYDNQFNSIFFHWVENDILSMTPENSNLILLIGREGPIYRLLSPQFNLNLDFENIPKLWTDFLSGSKSAAIFRKHKENHVVGITQQTQFSSSIYLEQLTQINFHLIISVFDILKEYTRYLTNKKKTALYLLRLKINRNYLVIIPEFRNDCRTNWGFFIAKMN